MIEIKNKRTIMKMTQQQLADCIGVEQNTVSQWESGVRNPRIELLPKLAKILNCTVDELLGAEKNAHHEDERF